MLTTHRRTPHRPLRVFLVLAIACLGCVESAAGRLAAAALGERQHRVELSLEDGHLDLVLRHGAGPESEDPIDRDHVVHLCNPVGVGASPKPALGLADPLAPATVTGFPPALVRADARWRNLEQHRAPLARPTQRTILLL